MSSAGSTDAMDVVLPFIIVKDAAAAIRFYKAAFGAVEVFRICDPGSGRIGHAELAIGRRKFALGDEHPGWGASSPHSLQGTSVSLQIYVADVDSLVRQAAGCGATVRRPVRDEISGDRAAMLVDPFGHEWRISTRREIVSPEETQRRWNEAAAGGTDPRRH